MDKKAAPFLCRHRASLANRAYQLLPKGGNSFRILGPLEVLYQDYTGSGARPWRTYGRTAVSSSCSAPLKVSPTSCAFTATARSCLPCTPALKSCPRFFPQPRHALPHPCPDRACFHLLRLCRPLLRLPRGPRCPHKMGESQRRIRISRLPENQKRQKY